MLAVVSGGDARTVEMREVGLGGKGGHIRWRVGRSAKGRLERLARVEGGRWA
jgi:hypothetical protein